MSETLTARELQTLRNMGNEAEAAAEEIDALRAEVEALREAAQEFIRDYIEGDMDDIKQYVRGFRAALTPAEVKHDD